MPAGPMTISRAGASRFCRPTSSETRSLSETASSAPSRQPVWNVERPPRLVASTDVHEMASFILESALSAAGAQVTNCGISCDPEDIVKVMVETDAESVVVTTHNGVARSFAITSATLWRTRNSAIAPCSWVGF